MTLHTSLGNNKISDKPFMQYPSDVQGEGSKYYVMFEINQQEKSSVTFPNTAYATTPAGQSSEFSTVSVPRPGTKRLEQAICLYMPASLEVTHKANYGEAEIGLIAAAAMGALKGFGGAGFEMNSVLDQARNEVTNAGLGILEGIGVTGAKATVEIQQGKVTNNRTEMKFEGIDRRSFSFTFKFLPKTASEAAEIEEIVRIFRFHSMPEFEGSRGNGRTMIIPSTFNIAYKPGIHLHRIGECALETVSVKFGGERPQFFVDHQPVETELTLQFKELDLVTKEKVFEGY